MARNEHEESKEEGKREAGRIGEAGWEVFPQIRHDSSTFLSQSGTQHRDTHAAYRQFIPSM